MNKILLPALFFLFASVTAFGQAPTLTAANINPVLNDSFASIICDTTGVLPGSSGASQTWDFTLTLLPNTSVTPDSGIGYVIYASSAPGYSTLSIAPGFTASTHAVVAPATSISSSSTTITNYYKEGISATSLTGIWVDATTNAVYTDAMDVLRFPFMFLTSFTDSYSGLVTYGGISATEAGTVTVTADAWGTLKLPGATFTNVLRVHSYQLFRDSAQLFGTVTTDTIETYTWYQANYHSPLLTIATTKTPIGNFKAVSYAKRQVANHVGVPDIKSIESSLAVYPNPSNNELNITFNTPSAQLVTISLYDMTGREVSVLANKTFQGTQNLKFNTNNLPKGTYLVSVQSGNSTVTRKIELQ